MLINGTTTVPVEVKQRPWYQGVLSFIGNNGVGFQTNGTNLQVGTMNSPNLVTVYSAASPQGIEGFQLPQPSPATTPSTQPAAVPLPVQVTTTNGNGASASNPPSSKPVAAPNPTPSSAQVPVATGGGKNPLQPVAIDQGVYTTADTAQTALKSVDKVPGLDGLGTHLGGAVGVVTNTVATLERINDPDFQNEPFVQQAGCAVFGTTVEVVGTLFTVPLALVLAH